MCQRTPQSPTIQPAPVDQMPSLLELQGDGGIWEGEALPCTQTLQLKFLPVHIIQKQKQNKKTVTMNETHIHLQAQDNTNQEAKEPFAITVQN